MKHSISILLILFPFFIFSQSMGKPNERELLALPLDSLMNYIIETFDNDIELTHLRCKVFLKSSQNKKDINHINYAYLYLAMSANNKKIALKYCDTLIDKTKNINDDRYPAFAHYMKAEVLYEHNENKNALSELLIANEKITQKTKQFYKTIIQQLIGILAANNGNHSLAIKYYHQSISNLTINNSSLYLTSLFGLTESHLALNNLDSVFYYVNTAHKNRPDMDSRAQAQFKLSEGRLAYKNGNYIKSKKLLSEDYPKLKEHNLLANTAICSYWIGKSEEKLNGIEEAIPFYIKVDSIFDLTQSVPIELRPAWINLVEYYRQINNSALELKYSRKLIKVDSALYKEFNFITEKITNSYVLPNIRKNNLKETESLQKIIKSSSTLIIALSSILVITAILFILYRRSELKKFKKYQMTIDKLQQSKSNQKNKTQKTILSPEKVKEMEEIIDHFEKTEAFLDPKISQNLMAIQYKSNSKYLSTYINKYKGVSFPDYLNNLRIEYVLNRLSDSVKNREDRFRIWSMSEVAKAAGFRSREYYSKAFLKYTNMKHLDYVRQLEKANKQNSNS